VSPFVEADPSPAYASTIVRTAVPGLWSPKGFHVISPSRRSWLGFAATESDVPTHGAAERAE
jgi:hypothetical protein